MIKNLICNSFFEIFFRAYNLSPHVPVDIIRVLFIPEFVAENLKANKNQPKRSLILKYSFAQKTSLLRSSTVLKLKIRCSQNTAKSLLSLLNLLSLLVTVWCQEKYLHCTISWRPRSTFLKHFKSKCLYISVYLSFCFKDEARFYLVVWGGDGGDWIISLRRLTV